MTQSEEQKAETTATPKADNAILQMILTMADTTWRMFVPILGLLIVGIYADKAIGSFPWLTLLGFLLGVGLSTILIRNQLRKRI